MNYNNIKMCEEHKNGQMPDDVLKKIKDKSIRFFSLIGVVLVGFTACTEEKDVKKDIEETTIPNETETNVEKDDYNDVTDKIDVPEQESTTSEKHEETVTSKEPEVEKPVDKKEEESKAKYNELLNKLNDELDKKDFSKEANQAIKSVLDNLYKNYPTWQVIYKDLPPVEEYIQNNLIDTIKNINSLTIYDFESEMGQKLQEEGHAFGETDSEMNITMIFSDRGGADDIESTFHEIIHCKQKKILFNEEYFEDNPELRLLILEGSTTFNQKFVNPLDVKVSGSWGISNESETTTIKYNKDNCIGYLVELNAFENLVYLAGYDTIDKVEKGEISLPELKDKIAQNYGRTKANKIWSTIREWYNSYNEAWKSDKTFKVAIELQELYFDCIKQDVNNLKPNQVKEYMDIWRGYKLKNTPQIEDSDDRNITNEFFDSIDEIDELLVDKIVESNTMYFTPDEEMNRATIKAVLFASNKGYYDFDGIYEDIYLPPTIKNTNYKYSGNGYLIITYENRDGETVNVGITYDENGIKEIKEADVWQYNTER
jgi:hypothetical protein